MCYRDAKSLMAGLQMALMLSACTAQIPQNIKVAPAGNPSLSAVREQAKDYLGRQVRWGGMIIETGNREDATRLTVLERRLGTSGRPEYSDDSAGRFIALVPEFLDPAVYAPDRRITVSGKLLPSETGKVGEYPYIYPVVEAEAWHLWPRETERPHGYEDPWWYDPWHYRPWYYDPWYPYGYPYPFHHHHRH